MLMFIQGIPFRTTPGFVTDGPNDSPEAFISGGSGPTYPRTTPQGNIVGYETSTTIVTRDRNAGNPSQLAGLHNNNDISGVLTYRIDLRDTGRKRVNWASGDANYAVSTAVDLYDGATRLQALSVTPTSAANNFRDATDVNLAAAAWVAGNTPVVRTFETTILRLKSVPDGVNNMDFTYVMVSDAPYVTSGLRTESRRRRAGWSVSSPGGFF